MADWVSIKAEYVAGGISFKKLAEKHGISVSSIKQHSANDPAGKWGEACTNAKPVLYQKTVQKFIERKSTHEADRLTRLLGIGDDLADKIHKATSELGTYAVIKRKQAYTLVDDEGEEHPVEDTVEIAKKTDAVICTADLKRIASALKDLRDVANTPRADELSLQKIADLMAGLDKEAADGAAE